MSVDMTPDVSTITGALRRARDEDAQDLFGLLSLCFAAFPGCYVDPSHELGDLRTAGSAFSAPGEGFWVAADASGRVFACVALDRPEEGTAEMHRLYVRPDRQRCGWGERLVRHVEDEAKAGGALRLVFWSDSRFTGAHRLYRRLGFRAMGETRSLTDISGTREHFFRKDFASDS